MPTPTLLTTDPPAAVEDALRTLGSNIRTARLRRRLRMEDLAERMGVSRYTVADLERGKPGTSAAAYFAALWALGLLGHAKELAAPERDEPGKALERVALPRRARRRRALDNDF